MENTCEIGFFYYTAYSNGITGLVGFTLNLFCVIVLANRRLLCTKQTGNMFKYLLMKSACDLLILFGRSLNPFLNCQTCFAYQRTSYGYKLAYLLKENYMKFVLLLCSMLFELATNIDRLKSIYNLKQKLNQQQNFILNSSIIILFSVLAYAYKFFIYQVKEYEYNSQSDSDYSSSAFNQTDNNTISTTTTTTTTAIIEFKLKPTEMFYSPFNVYYSLVLSIFKDVLCVLFLILINVLVIIKMRKLVKHKTRLSSASSTLASSVKRAINNNNNNKIITETKITTRSRSTRAQVNLTRLTVVTSLISIVTRLPITIKYLPFTNLQYNLCFIMLIDSLYEFSVSINFFVYYLFNKRFRKYFQYLLSKSIFRLLRRSRGENSAFKYNLSKSN